MNFDFFPIPRIVFGPGRIRQLPELLSALGVRPLLIHNYPLPESIASILPAASVTFLQTGEPKAADVDAATQLARNTGRDCLIGLGGGSAIDTAKAVAGLLTHPGSVVDYLEIVGTGAKVVRPAAPWIAIPTTAGTGAEATRNAVIAVPEKQFKASMRSEHLLPRFILVDPELHVTVPPEVTAASGMDALCQCIEAYTSSGASPMTDAIALDGVELAGRSLRTAYTSPGDIAARSDMALAALFSGIALTNAGLGAVHGFAAPVGANFPVPHGVVCAALLPQVIWANMAAARQDPAKAPLLARYHAIGRRLGADPGQFTAGLLVDLRIPPLSRYGMELRHVPEMVQLAKRASSMRYNPVTLGDAVLGEILAAGIKGGM
ncbi:MAG: iron-containing alcohol dehydrogenase [Tepidisphaeraceae bacterium]